MNIVNKLTLRHLKLNKKRTIVTVVGIIISVAMITAVSTLGVSFMDLMARQTIASDGQWHVLYQDVNKAQIEAIENDKDTKQVILNKSLGYAILEGSQNSNKPYLYIEEYNKAGFENFPIKLKDGRLPEASDELVISDAIITNGKVDYKIGDSITLDIGSRKAISGQAAEGTLRQNLALQKTEGKIDEEIVKEITKTYTIVGIIDRPTFEPTWSPGFSVFSYIDKETITTKETLNAGVILTKVNNKLYDKIKNFADENGIENVGYNNDLLKFYGVVQDDGVRNGLLKLCVVIMGVIAVGSISLIYNAFAISVSERSRHLGMLSSVGATKRQKRNSVFFEGFVLGTISIPIGIFGGLLGMGITFWCINPLMKGSLGITENFELVVSPLSILIAVAISIVTILISTYMPARRASNISAIEAIRQTTDVKLNRRNVKTSKLTGRIFGIEGDIALKNLKRNKKRYKATVFSLIISVVLFLVVDFFNGYLKKSIVMTQAGINYDISVGMNGIDEKKKETIVKKIDEVPEITEKSVIDSFVATMIADEETTADFLKGSNKAKMEDGKYKYYISVCGLKDDALEKYAKEVGIDFNKLKDTNKPEAIVIDEIKYKDSEVDKYIETKVIKTDIGENLALRDNKKEQLCEVGVAMVTDKIPMGVMNYGKDSHFNIIVSMDVFNKLVGQYKEFKAQLSNNLFLESKDSLKVQEKIETIVEAEGLDRANVENISMFRQREEQAILLISIFEYGFIVLITLISVANIFNTISTSVALRKREFAMLKSVGMTPNSFNKMINYESIFYGIKALLYGLPISFIAMYLIYKSLNDSFQFNFEVPWVSVLVVMISVFFIVGITMLYSGAKIRKENIVDVLKQEII